MSRWSRIVAWQRARAFSDNPPGYPTQQELEQAPGYTPGGVNVGIYDGRKPPRPKRDR